MSILLTGNKGFIGSGLAKFLYERHPEGVGIDGIDLKDGLDILSYKAQKQYKVVIHTAAKVSVTESEKDPDIYFKTNVQGTWNLVRQHPEAHFIYLSTCAIYGEGLEHTIASPAVPTSVYALTKFLGEIEVMAGAKKWTVLRLTNVVGDGERGEPNVLQIFKNAERLSVYGDGLQTRDFVPVEKVHEAILTAFHRLGVFNVGSGKSRTILDVAKEFKKPIDFLPARQGEIRNFGIKDAFNYLT